MAGVLPADQEAEVLLSKRVQEMVLDGELPPALYICRDGKDTDDHTDSSMVSLIPVIDLSLESPSCNINRYKHPGDAKTQISSVILGLLSGQHSETEL